VFRTRQVVHHPERIRLLFFQADKGQLADRVASKENPAESQSNLKPFLITVFTFQFARWKIAGRFWQFIFLPDGV
jgi:hypothetical protein